MKKKIKIKILKAQSNTQIQPKTYNNFIILTTNLKKISIKIVCQFNMRVNIANSLN